MIFARAVPIYQEAGWTGTFPLPVGLKYPPPDDVTGNYPPINPNQVEDWLEEYPGDSNIGLRMALAGEYEVLGIDIDQYDSKTGWDTYKQIAETLGAKLPPTFKSSSRGVENPSGIHFYRVPAGWKWKGKFGADIEVIQRTHRYAVVWPSTNPDSEQQYQWLSTNVDGQEAVELDEPPHVDDLPLLPQEWIDYLLKDTQTDRQRTAGTDISEIDAHAWMAETFPGFDERPSSSMARIIDPEVLAAEMEAGAHDAMVSKIHAAVRLGVEGHHGLEQALKQIYLAFQNEVLGVINSESARRSIIEVKSEWYRALTGEISKLQQDIDEGYVQISAIGGYSADDGETDTDAITRKVIDLLAQRRSRDLDMEDYPNNHRGVGKMVRDFWGDDLRPILQNQEWAFWNEALKRLKRLKTADLYHMVELGAEIPLRQAAEALWEQADAMDEAGEEDEAKKLRKEGGELMRRSESAGNVSTMDASLKVAHSLPGEFINLEHFDTNPLTFGASNGVIDLTPIKDKDYDEPLLREGSLKDLILLNTEVPWEENFTHPLWENYLDTFLPDPAYRRFVRKVLGYALMGGNPRRLMIFLQGPTSTGKTTIMEAIQAATGEYTTTVAANALFREKQDAGPAPEMLTAMPKRIVFSSEVSGRNRLHADVIKRVTGGDELAARALYSNDIVVRRPMFTPVIATNSAPTIADGDAALWRRLLVLPFDHQVPPDSVVMDRIENDPDAVKAVLAWLIEGLRDYLMEGLDPNTFPDEIVERQRQFIGDTGDFQQFLAEHVEYAPGAFVDRDKIYQLYCSWAVAEGIKDAIPRNWFVRRMTENGIDHESKSLRNKETKRTRRATVFTGIKLSSS